MNFRLLFRGVAYLLAASLVSRAQPADPVLRQALAKLQSSAQHLARYACIETVERSYFERPATPAAACSDSSQLLEGTDRLRLEVTVADGREIYSWPGATRFDTGDLDTIIREGPIGTGSFGTHLLAILGNPLPAFQFAGRQDDGPGPLIEYRFQVPLAASHYRVRTGASSEAVPYDGSLWLDAGSLELQRMVLHAEALSAATTMCELNAEMDYHRVGMGESDLLLPSQSRLHIGYQSGRRTTNVTSFSGCRAYLAESEMVFEEDPQIKTNAAAPVRTPVALPIGLPVTLALTAPIDSETAAAGDPVAAKVVRPVRRPGSSAILIPPGAIVRGRLTRVEHHVLGEPYFLIAMSLNRMEWEGLFSAFAARAEPNPDLVRQLGANSATGGGLRFWNSGTFLFPTGKPRYTIPEGYEMKWTTLAARSR